MFTLREAITMVKRNHKKKELDQLQTVKRENQELKREVGKLRKQLRRSIEVEYIEEDEKSDIPIVEKISKAASCPKCKDGVIEEVELGAHMLKVCNLCTYRKIKLGVNGGK